MADESIRDRAWKLFRPPFRYQRGYVWDKDNEMVADSRTDEGASLRVRGWGRLTHIAKSGAEAEALQDMTGELIAEALSAQWRALRKTEAKGGAIEKCSCTESEHLRAALQMILRICTGLTPGRDAIADLAVIANLADQGMKLVPLVGDPEVYALEKVEPEESEDE